MPLSRRATKTEPGSTRRF